MPPDEDLAEHELAVGGTRPALFPYLGIPWRDFVVFVVAGMYSVLFRWQFLILIGAAMLYSARLYRKDYNAGRCFLCWMETSARHMTNALGGSFISPRPARAFRGIA